MKLTRGDRDAIPIPEDQMPPQKTIESWMTKESNGPVHHHRRPGSNPRRLLTLDEEHDLIRSVVKRRDRKEAVNYSWIHDRIFAMKPGLRGGQVSEGYVSKLLKRHGIVTRRASGKDSFKDTAVYQDRRDGFRHAWAEVKEDYGERVFCMDEAGIFKSQIVRQTYDRKGINTASVRKKYLRGENGRDTLVGCVGITGVKVPVFYVKYCRRLTKKKKQKKVSGMNNDILAFWIVKIFLPFLRGERVRHTLFDATRQGPRYTEEYLFSHADHTPLPQRYALMWDQLSSHKRDTVQEFLETMNVMVMRFPPKAASDLSSLDNSTFAAWRTLYKSVRAQRRLGMFRATVLAWEALRPEGIAHCWAHCLDEDRAAHSTETWKKKRSELRRELVMNADREVEVSLDDLDGDDEPEEEQSSGRVFFILFFFYFFFFFIFIYFFFF
jgi:hypothetical protein